MTQAESHRQTNQIFGVQARECVEGGGHGTCYRVKFTLDGNSVPKPRLPRRLQLTGTCRAD